MPPLKASQFPRAFLTYDLEEKKFYSPEEAINLGLTITGDGLPYWTKAPRQVVILWFSGQLDSKKQPLFEGDLVRMEVESEFGSIVPNILGVMRWDKKDSRFILIMAGDTPRQIYKTLKIEKIGHEFVNPDLVAQIEKPMNG